MKRTLVHLICVLTLIACNNADKKDLRQLLMSDLQNARLNGQISSYEESTFKTDSLGNIIGMDSCCTFIYEYDKYGFLIKRSSRDKDGSFTEELMFEHFNNGLWKGVKWKDKESIGSEVATVDDNGNYLSINEYDSLGKIRSYYTDVTKNEDGQMLTWKQYNMDSILIMSEVAVYDKNLLTKKILKDGDAKLIFSKLYKYNDRGEQIEVSTTSQNLDTTTTIMTKYTYEVHDSLGNWTHSTKWDDKGNLIGIRKRNYKYWRE
jgi:hypothetical protein